MDTDCYSVPPLPVSDLDRQEAELVQAVNAGDKEAFEALYGAYYRRLFRFLLRTGVPDALVEEVINDTLYVVWTRADSFLIGSRVSTWVFGIAWNKARSALRSVNRRHQHETSMHELASEDYTCAESDSSDDPSARVMDGRELVRGLAVLSPEQRAVVELTYGHGMSYKEIAVVLQCPANTVKTRMFHARKLLRRYGTGGQR